MLADDEFWEILKKFEVFFILLLTFYK